MSRMKLSRVSVLLFLLFSSAALGQQGSKLKVIGEVQRLEISTNDLARMPRISLDVQDPHSGERHHYQGVRLSDLLARAGAPLGEALKGKALSKFVLAKAADGYAVVYSLAEIDPAMNGNQAILADTIDGKPLDGKQGPFRIVIPGEKRAARWMRMVTSLEILDALTSSAMSPQ